MLNATSLPPTRLRGSEHSVRFHESDQLLLAEAADFLDGALRAGGLAIAIATAAHRDELHRRLSGFGGPPEHATRWLPGPLVLLDAEEMLEQLMVHGWPDAALLEALVAPMLARAPAGRPIHVFGMLAALLSERGEYEAALALEALWNELASRYRFSLFCAYPHRLFSFRDGPRIMQRICRTHTRTLGAGDQAGDAPDEDAAAAGATPGERVAALEAEVERRREAEKTLRARETELAEFLENACEGIHKLAPDGTILYANRAELELLGYRWDEYVGHNAAEFHVDADLLRDLLARVHGGEVVNDRAALLRRRDDSQQPVRLHTNGCFEGEELRYTRCFMRDATERVALDAALGERDLLLQELRDANRAKDQFLAMLGHELRNPLSPIVTALHLMRMRGDTGTGREQAIIQRQVEHMVRLVDDLLDISRVTRGKIELKRESVDVQAVLAKAVEQAGVLLEQRRHQLQIDAQPGLRCEGDPVRLAQVIANLLTNAARYTDAGGSIHVRAWQDGAERIAISVRDNGLGIAPEMLPRIFELFYQGGERGLARSQGGLGIGLALVKSLVELHGGSIEAASAGRGRGSEFVVRLPCPPAAESRPDRAPEAVAAPAAAGLRVLLVDDNVDAAETLAQLLEWQGHQVTVFHEPLSALAHVAEVRPEAAVLDIGLPVMDGYELGRRLRETCGPDCLLVALTGYGQDGDRARSAAAGFDCHLVKPVDPHELFGVLAPRCKVTAEGAR